MIEFSDKGYLREKGFAPPQLTIQGTVHSAGRVRAQGTWRPKSKSRGILVLAYTIQFGTPALGVAPTTKKMGPQVRYCGSCLATWRAEAERHLGLCEQGGFQAALCDCGPGSFERRLDGVGVVFPH